MLMPDDFKTMYDQSPIGLWRTTLTDGVFLYINKAAADIFGCAVSEMIDHKSTDFYDPAARKQLIDELKLHGKILNYEIEIRRCDGKTLWVSISAILNSEGNYIEGSVQDMTEKKNAEDGLLKKHWEELEKITILQQNIKKKIEEVEAPVYKNAWTA